jgi:tRNA (adenine22-N1)-methyltransferase
LSTGGVLLDIVKGMKLSNRLQFIYENLLPGMPVWDFCCDHGYLGVEALKSGQFPKVFFVDQVPHIVENVESVVAEKFSEFLTRAHFIVSKGEEIEEVVQGNVVIAGVGAFAIFKILRALCDRHLLQAHRLIFCPQRDEEKFVAMLNDLGESFTARFFLFGTTLLEERFRSRTIYIFERIEKV